MGIRLGILGTGEFASAFIPLFRAHPLVARLALCDHVPAKAAALAARHGITEVFTSFEDLLASDVDAVAVFTQHWMHGPQAVRALEAGKDVYSAVPAAIDLAEMEALVRAVERTGRIYMMGETSAYRPEAILCRERFARGEFGAIVYAQAEYIHDWEDGCRDVNERRFGADWRHRTGMPPMLYPTHSIGMALSVTGAHATQVSCLGVPDPGGADPEVWREDNAWGNRFSNQTALMQLSDGSAMRINEMRRLGHPSVERMSLYGSDACFESSCAGQWWLGRRTAERLDDQLAVGQPAYERMRARLPRALRGDQSAHGGSHAFLVDDFAKACAWRLAPPLHVWQAARFLVPGHIAAISARRGGAMLPVADHGAGPAVDRSAFERCADAMVGRS